MGDNSDKGFVKLDQTSEEKKLEEPKGSFNYNVVLTLIVVGFSGCADSVWAGTVLAAYLYIQTGSSNAKVGYVEAASGLATLITALPVGYIADKYGRTKACVLGGVCLMVANFVTTWTVFENEPYIILLFAMCLWGAGNGVVNGPVQALYADSVPTGKRSLFYVYLYATYLLVSMVGPAITIAIFELDSFGDWTMKELKLAIYAGMGLELIVAILLFFFDDSKALGIEADQTFAMDEKNQRDNIRNSSSMDTDDLTKQLILEEEVIDVSPAELASIAKRKRKRTALIPKLTFAAGLLAALGSGMTVKFFPLFFKNDCDMTPTGVQAIYLCVPLIMVVFSVLSRLVSKTLGRVQTIMICKGVGVTALFLMVYLERYRGDWRVMVPIYLFRTGIMNCTYPLEESISMDFVPKDQRARWKSLESVAVFGWCGSAAVGGILADKFGYPYTFLITAIVQGCSLFIWAGLLPLVPRKEMKSAALADD